MKTLILYRGLPGSGKTTAAKMELLDFELHKLIEADHFFGFKGAYEFNPELLPAAHGWCQGETRRELGRVDEDYGKVVVANTFTQAWEIEPYTQIANDYMAALVIVDLFDAGLNDYELAERCVHNVPVETITKMRERWEKVTLVCTDQVYSICPDMSATTVSGK